VARIDSTAVVAPAFGTAPSLPLTVEALHRATLEFFAADDAGEIAGKALTTVGQLVAVETASLWVLDGDEFECRGAVGRDRLSGVRVQESAADGPLIGEEGLAILTAKIAVNGNVNALLRVSRPLLTDIPFSDGEQEIVRQLADAAGAAMANANRLSLSQRAAAESARDLSLLSEMSREIVSTLDLDRVLRSVVNLATRMLSFDRGAVALYEHGTCDIRAVAGVDGVDAKSPTLQDLAVRGAWAAGVGEPFYLSDRDEPASDAERTFVQIFRGDLERDGVMSGLYLPLRDEEGIVGILLFEAAHTELATPRQRELATILTSQATVAVRNARLYHQVPLADAMGAISARKEAFLAIPRARRMTYVAVAVLVVAALTLIRWPLRIAGNEPVFRPLLHAEVRPTLAGVVDRVFVREGSRVERGAPVAHLQDDELLARRDASLASVAAAERAAVIAASHGAAADERLERLRVGVLRREADLLEEQIRSSIVRSPVSGDVLTARPEERVGTRVEAGDLLAVVGRTDSLELEFGVDQRDVTRIHVGDEVRLRVAALPQQTFSGRVVTIAPLASGGEGTVSFPVRSVVANDRGLLRPGMAAYARVLAEPSSLLGRLARDPVRAIRLFWWRMWS
jgi:GAF domain-containing protein/multidrug resistance efflux pump